MGTKVRITPEVVIEPIWVHPSEAAAMVGGQAILQDLLDAEWLKPVTKQKSRTLYDVKDIRLCADRAKLDGFPSKAR